MDRLSAYAARESESEPAENRQRAEEEATTALLEKLRISKEKTKKKTAKADGGDSTPPNGAQVNGDRSLGTPAQDSEQLLDREAEPSNGLDDGEKSPARKKGIPKDVKLYEIFYDQVINLVNAQRLHIQDTIALLASLSNLAL